MGEVSDHPTADAVHTRALSRARAMHLLSGAVRGDRPSLDALLAALPRAPQGDLRGWWFERIAIAFGCIVAQRPAQALQLRQAWENGPLPAALRTSATPEPEVPTMAQPAYLRDVLRGMAADPSRSVSIEDLAASVGVTGRTLRKAFRQFLGISPADHLTRLRSEVEADVASSPPTSFGAGRVIDGASPGTTPGTALIGKKRPVHLLRQ